MDLTGLGAVADLAKDVVNRFFPDKTEQEKQQLAATMMVIQGQLDTNKNEAQSVSLFTSGWRPFVGWTCGSAFAIKYVVGPMVEWGSALIGHPTQFPHLEMSELMPILIGMLGLGYYRTQEKIAGVTK